MAVINRIAGLADEMKAWRRHIHMNPELGRECHETAAFVVERLKEFGVDEITTGWAESGVVAVINGQGEGPAIGLRADMDALPMEEITGLEYASKIPGKMHACGHDGHTAMLLGAAKYLSETRNFAGKAVLIFQPDEELSGGGEAMVKEGMMERFGIDEVYAIHNGPGLEAGIIGTVAGPIMAAVDSFYIDIQGKGPGGTYFMALREDEAELLVERDMVADVQPFDVSTRRGTLDMYPNTNTFDFATWELDNYGPIHLPAAGETVPLTPRNVALYRRVITAYEGHTLEERGEEVFIDGAPATSYTFEQGYYWLMGDNRHSSADSRYWGFVPADHVVGRACFTWFSKMNTAQHGESGIRWDRMFKSVK